MCNTEKVKLIEVMCKYSFATSAKRHGFVTLHWEYQTVNGVRGVTAVCFEDHIGDSKGSFLCIVKACGESRGIAPLILKLDIRWRAVVNITPRPLYPQKSTPLATG